MLEVSKIKRQRSRFWLGAFAVEFQPRSAVFASGLSEGRNARQALLHLEIRAKRIANPDIVGESAEYVEKQCVQRTRLGPSVDLIESMNNRAVIAIAQRRPDLLNGPAGCRSHNMGRDVPGAHRAARP